MVAKILDVLIGAFKNQNNKYGLESHWWTVWTECRESYNNINCEIKNS